MTILNLFIPVSNLLRFLRRLQELKVNSTSLLSRVGVANQSAHKNARHAVSAYSFCILGDLAFE